MSSNYDTHPELGHKLLTAAEERDIAEAMARGDEIFRRLHDGRECFACRPLYDERRPSKLPSPAAAMIGHNMQLAWCVASRQAEHADDREEFYAEALAAMKAELHRFDPDVGRFAPLASVIMRRAVSRFRADNRPVNGDTKLKRLEPRVAQARQTLTAELGRPPLTVELAGELGVDPLELELYMAGLHADELAPPADDDEDGAADVVVMTTTQHRRWPLLPKNVVIIDESPSAATPDELAAERRRVAERGPDERARMAKVRASQRQRLHTAEEIEAELADEERRLRQAEADFTFGGADEALDGYRELEELVHGWMATANLTDIEEAAVNHWFGRGEHKAAGTFAELGELIGRDASNAHRALQRGLGKVAAVMTAAGIESPEGIYTIMPPPRAAESRTACARSSCA